MIDINEEHLPLDPAHYELIRKALFDSPPGQSNLMARTRIAQMFDRAGVAIVSVAEIERLRAERDTYLGHWHSYHYIYRSQECPLCHPQQVEQLPEGETAELTNPLHYVQRSGDRG